MCEALCKVLRLRMDTKMKKKICQSGPQTNREIDMCRNLKKKKVQIQLPKREDALSHSKVERKAA